MNVNALYLKNEYAKNTDFVIREVNIGKREKVYIVFFESLADSVNIFNFIIRPIENYLNVNKKVKNIEKILSGPKLENISNIDDIFYYLENGFVGVLYKDEIYVLEIKASLDRGINTSDTEPNMYGPKDAFCENYQKNIGLIKRRVKTKSLKVESLDRGVYTKNKLSLLYISDKASMKKVEKVKMKLNKNCNTDILDTYELVKDFSGVFPTILKTEKPVIVSEYLLKGYIVIILDNSPFALIVDAKLENHVNPLTTNKFVRVLRYVCLFLNVLTPAIYIALINFNQETIPTSLLINFSKQRMGVPFPAIVEAVIMLMVCEILREADIRFPNNYGSSASIVGALVLGDAAVNAGIVSPIMIIIVAISFISGLIFTDVKLVNVLRIMRFLFLGIASFLGLYGLSIAMVVMLAVICDVKMIEGTYV